MFKEIMIAMVMMSLLIGNSWDADASRQPLQPVNAANLERDESKVREKRFINPFTGLIKLWNALTHIYSLYVEQKNETYFAFEQTHDIIADGFNDTYMSTIRPTTTEKVTNDSGMATTTPKYRISRKEVGYILGRNFRGLKKLFDIELYDALHPSKHNVKKYSPPKNKTSSSKN